MLAFAIAFCCRRDATRPDVEPVKSQPHTRNELPSSCETNDCGWSCHTVLRIRWRNPRLPHSARVSRLTYINTKTHSLCSKELLYSFRRYLSLIECGPLQYSADYWLLQSHSPEPWASNERLKIGRHLQRSTTGGYMLSPSQYP